MTTTSSVIYLIIFFFLSLFITFNIPSLPLHPLATSIFFSSSSSSDSSDLKFLHVAPRRYRSTASSSSPAALLLSSSYKIIVFTDSHFGEDEELDRLTQQFHRKALQSHDDDDFDLAVVLGDSVSLEDYAELRRPAAAAATTTTTTTISKSTKNNKYIKSCLRRRSDDKGLSAAASCWRDSHAALFDSSVPIAATLAGNHDEAIFSSTLFENLKDENGVSSRKRFICDPLAMISNDRACSISIPRNVDVKNKDQKKTKTAPTSPQALLHFFNSVSQESDLFLLHGYKYPSNRQLDDVTRHASGVMTTNTKTHNLAKNDDDDDVEDELKAQFTRPLQIAFVHIPSSLFLSRSSIVASGGTFVETPGCSPKALQGTRDFAEWLLSPRNADIVVVGHDHGNSEWAVHDREKLAEAADLLFLPLAAAGHNQKENHQKHKNLHHTNELKNTNNNNNNHHHHNFKIPEFLHLLYAKHSGFGGYFNVPADYYNGISSQTKKKKTQIQIEEENQSLVPGAQVLEINEVKPSSLGPLSLPQSILKVFDQVNKKENRKTTSDVKAALLKLIESFRCRQLSRSFADLKMCRFMFVVDDKKKDNHDDVKNSERGAGGGGGNGDFENDVSSTHPLERGGVYVIVRSYILEAVLSKNSDKDGGGGGEEKNLARQEKQQHRRGQDAEKEKEEEEEEEIKLKSSEPAQRLLHSRLKGFHVSGVRVDNQILRSKGVLSSSSSSSSSVSFPLDECTGQMDYRSQFTVVVVLMWVAYAALAVATLYKFRAFIFDTRRKIDAHVV